MPANFGKALRVFCLRPVLTIYPFAASPVRKGRLGNGGLMMSSFAEHLCPASAVAHSLSCRGSNVVPTFARWISVSKCGSWLASLLRKMNKSDADLGASSSRHSPPVPKGASLGTCVAPVDRSTCLPSEFRGIRRVPRHPMRSNLKWSEQTSAHPPPPQRGIIFRLLPRSLRTCRLGIRCNTRYRFQPADNRPSQADRLCV